MDVQIPLKSVEQSSLLHGLGLTLNLTGCLQMRIVCLSIILLTMFSLSIAAFAGEAVKTSPQIPKLPPGFDPDKMGDKAEAAKAADWLEKEYGDKKSEAVRMLIAVLRGIRSDGRDAWFGPAESRFNFDWLATQAGVDPKAKAIPRDKLKAPAALLDRLDRDGDGKITPGDLDWSEQTPYSQQAAIVNRIFRRMNTSGDGRLTREQLDEFFKRVAKGKDFTTMDDFRELMLPRGTGGFLPGDGPSVPMLVKSLFSEELGALSEGPKVGDVAPDFTLKTRDANETVQLSKVVGKKPTVLLLGNFTCGPFRAFYPDVDAVSQRYKDQANFLMVYVREAHPTDGWKMISNERSGVAVKQPTTLAERTGVCDQFCKKLKPNMPVYVDEINDPVGRAYSGMPARLYVIDSQGKIAYKGGRGPFGFNVGEMENALVMALIEQVNKP